VQYAPFWSRRPVGDRFEGQHLAVKGNENVNVVQTRLFLYQRHIAAFCGAIIGLVFSLSRMIVVIMHFSGASGQ